MHFKGFLITAGGAVLVVGLGAAAPAGAAAKPLSATVRNDTLTVTGSSADDTIGIQAAGNTVEVDFDGDGSAEHTFDRSTFSKIVVDAGSNDDFVAFSGTIDETVTIDGGSGNDELLGSSGVDKIDAGSGNDFVDGQQGNDSAVLGSGNDTFQWDPGDGSDKIDGRSGEDTLLFNGNDGAEIMRLFPNGRDSVFTRDLGNIRMDMTKVESLDLNALGGADTITVDDMSGTAFRNSDVDLSASPSGSDGQADVVKVNGTNGDDDIEVDTADRGRAVAVTGLQVETTITGSAIAEDDQLQIDGRGGNDTVDIAAGVANLIRVVEL